MPTVVRFIEPCLPSHADRPSSAPIGFTRSSRTAIRLMARRDPGYVKKMFLIAAALTSPMTGGVHAQDHDSSSILRSLPSEVQKEIDDIRMACREHLVNANESQTRISSGDEGLEVFTVSGVQAVMIDERELCDGCFKGANCTNRGSYGVTIYLRSGKAWRKALSTEATGSVFLSTGKTLLRSRPSS
jgi:hypothetical protein